MPTTATLLVFTASTLALLVVPGPSVVYVVARSLEHGRAAGLMSMLGLETGALLHVAAAAGGLTALLASSPWAFTTLRYVGAAYLISMGIRQFLERHHGVAHEGSSTSPSKLHLFRAGVLVDVLNPKTGLFFLAFLPQFVDPARGAASTQIIVLGLCFVALAVLTDGTYALVAGALRPKVTASGRGQRLIRRVTGAVYTGLGGLAAVV